MLYSILLIAIIILILASAVITILRIRLYFKANKRFKELETALQKNRELSEEISKTLNAK